MRRKTQLWLAVAIALPSVIASAAAQVSQARLPPLPPPLVRLSDVDPTIVQDLRYAGARNFTGAKVDGYEAGICILTASTAAALARAQKRLQREKPEYTLVVYDCYRPVRAVRAFMKWVAHGPPQARGYHHPRTERHRLLELGYIAPNSAHSRGYAVDVGLAHVGRALHSVEYVTADCSAPAGDRDLDMGTSFDCFDVRSSTRSSLISPNAAAARQHLLRVLRAEGFHNYHREWWHFTYPAGDGGRSFDFPIRR
jgi:D-alanyl-D-alanine dipeptidase